MAEYNNIEAKLEAVFKQILEDATIAGITHYTGQSAEPLSLPRSWSYAPTFNDLIPGSATGNFRGIVEIGVESRGVTDPTEPSPVPAHQALVAAVRDAVLKPDLVALLNAAALALALELTIIDVLNANPSTDQETAGPFLTNLLHIEVIAANASI